MKKVIGIVPKGVLFGSETPNTSDVYHLGNNYVKRIQQAGAIPVCLAPVDGRLDPEQLALCDGFVAQGGSQMWPYHFQVIHHAVSHGKKYLGICLGMQLIHRYFAMRKMVQDCEGDVLEQIIDLFCVQHIGEDLLKPVQGHRLAGITRENTDCVKHGVDALPGTLLHRLLGREHFQAASFHNWCVEDPVAELTVNARATDGTIEGIEYGSNVLCVQFHPEVDDLLPEIFQFLTEE